MTSLQFRISSCFSQFCLFLVGLLPNSIVLNYVVYSLEEAENKITYLLAGWLCLGCYQALGLISPCTGPDMYWP